MVSTRRSLYRSFYGSLKQSLNLICLSSAASLALSWASASAQPSSLATSGSSLSLESTSTYKQHEFQAAEQMHQFLTISSTEVHRIPLSEVAQLHELLAAQPVLPPKRPLAEPGLPDFGSLQTWITLGAKAWNFVVANKPVASVSNQRVSVFPEAAVNWSNLENWRAPKVQAYEFRAKNLLGATVVSHKYVISMNYGGQFHGRGQFLANATVIPAGLSVLWGYTVSSKVQVGQTVNIATADNPVPAVELELDWSIDTVLKHEEGRENYFVQGNGLIRQTSSSAR